MRLHKPVGIFLLLWPTLWALWLASLGQPSIRLVIIFICGVILMRSAGCVINDFADRHFDAHVERTQQRPLATGAISAHSALILFMVLCGCAFLLVLFLNRLVLFLAVIGALLTVFYPFMKRFTYLPQAGLGIAFSWGVPMAFAAELNDVPWQAWIIFLTAVIWPIIYDTMYAMVDYQDDIKIGIKSSAILFKKNIVGILGLLQIIFLFLLVSIGFLFHLQWFYFFSLSLVAIALGYQLWLIKDWDRKKCFKAFLDNQWIGMFIFAGIWFG